MSITYKYQPGQNLCHMMKCYLVLSQMSVSDAPAYRLKRCSDGEVLENVLESNCMDCDGAANVVNELWPEFSYTGDKAAAFRWVMDHLIKKISACANVSFGPSADGSSYTFSCAAGNWTKAKSA